MRRIKRGGGNGGEPAWSLPGNRMVSVLLCAGFAARPAHNLFALSQVVSE
jgi:hypothetical protein